MKRILLLTAMLSFGLTSWAETDAPNEGQFYISPGAVVYEGPGSSNIGFDDTEIGPGLILGYAFTDRWALEFLAGRTEAESETVFGRSEDDIDLTWLDLVYKLNSRNGWQPFLLGGFGRSEYNFDGVRPDAKDNQFNAGIGVYRALSDNISLRADLRGVSTTKEGGLKPMAFIGITGFLGQAKAPPPPADSDGDGVPNDIDKCPTTPPGRVVDADGCQLDSDGDGVVDAEDQCPDTPKGAPVNRVGCPLDTDGDGVPDYRDKCPGSERGAKVDADGCYVELEEDVSINMYIEFETNKAEIRPDHVSEIQRVVDFLRQYPTANAVIGGHTDSDGSARYNQNLSERRARAVYEYLIGEAGISADRLDWAGFGESQPIASNDTAAGKQRNRRVTAVVSGTHKVRQ